MQNANIVRLFCHEVLRVFTDRMNDPQDETTFRSILYKTVTLNFCTAKDEEEEKGIVEEEEEEQDEMAEEEVKEVKPQKKGVTFKTGLLSERNAAEFFRGALINIDQVIVIFG